MNLLLLAVKSLFSYKRPLNRGRFWLSILVVAMLIAAGFYVAQSSLLNPSGLIFAELPLWHKSLTITLLVVGMLLWMSSLASRAYLCQKPRFLFVIATWFPPANFILTLMLGVIPATRPGSEERPTVLWTVLQYIVATLFVLALLGAVIGAVVEFFQNETVQLVISGTLFFIIFHKFAQWVLSGESSPSTPKRRAESKQADAAAETPVKAERKEVGVYVVNEGGYRDQKIRVYSDGDTFTAVSNLKDIEAKTFKALEPLIIDSFRNIKEFRLIESKVY